MSSRPRALVYARPRDAREEVPTGYDAAALDLWAARARQWAGGEAPDGLEYIEPPATGPAKARDVFVFMINGAKVRAPAAAQALLARL